MNTAINYDEQIFQEDDQENFADVIQPMLDFWLPQFRHIADNPIYASEALPILRAAALMAWLPAKSNIPVAQEIIENFREIFKITRHNILENPACASMSQTDRENFEKFSMRLAKAITVLDIANDEEIAKIFTRAEK